ncbi:hypothetical protein CANTEDRAFT_97700 [Yamadazyma tenuis ATCC 10573]|uniref:Uncharacterized protein n=1 Tax=Candida tenuis (strain ATCC 10573 / BCRC 21748 / CBS 615 / JCM 9827 / NBRC 10315 / NRRL Y-1498 / VKM Y-70) TaxID=590646 RepID=G3B156_CANTC|nr:uncharacterized protein CANTEDRAFT_97700 [Yamadazyma tenuis ATCC 10573]EGV64883.1 hypothetical protein CANTEDRAFT_97700 [Yamadazyma tenuis ATCC 10573]
MDLSIDPNIQHHHHSDNSTEDVDTNTSPVDSHVVTSSDAPGDGNLDHVFTLNEYMKSDNDEEVDGGESNELEMIDFSVGDDASDKSTGLVDPKPSLVEYKHKEKAQRLGRPRNHVLNNIKTSPEESNQNEEKSKYMLYRLDDQPVEGPGSRGGKGDVRQKKGKITSDTLRKRKQKQAQLSFGSTGIKLLKKDTHEEEIDKDVTTEKGVVAPEKKIVKVEQNPKSVVALDTESASTEAPKKANNSVAKSGEKKKPSKEKHVVSASRTTVLNGRNKLTRQFPGPVIGLYYDLYDENVMNSAENKIASTEELALGFNVKKAPYASDVIFLVSYISKFKDIIALGNIGPQDIEKGICLEDEAEEPQEVSPLMNELFCRLVTLVLNRKPDVNPKYQGKAVSELKAVCTSLGLPYEWKDSNEMYQKFTVEEDPANIVDESNPDILIKEGYVFKPPYVYENPFNDKQGFEKLGFPGISSGIDRLIMLRTLAQWSLTASNEIKAAIVDFLQKQDIPGDKETFYASRAVLKGFKHTEDLTTEINNKIAKKKYSEDNESVARYVEPVADPMDHPLRLRLDEMIAGDVGFNVGRFFFVRVSNESDGGVSSVKKMKHIWSDLSSMRASYASRFKFYVQDTHKLLVDRLNGEGIEFTESGEEKTSEKLSAESIDSHYYEVASNSEQLELFVMHLEAKLGISVTGDIVSIIPSSSVIYKPVKALYEYLFGMLPLLKQQESLRAEARSSRKRTVDYSDVNASKKMKVYLEDDVEEQHEEPDDDEDADFHEDLDEIAQIDDDEDDDYQD